METIIFGIIPTLFLITFFATMKPKDPKKPKTPLKTPLIAAMKYAKEAGHPFISMDANGSWYMSKNKPRRQGDFWDTSGLEITRLNIVYSGSFRDSLRGPGVKSF
jgi:hypothetical protein